MADAPCPRRAADAPAGLTLRLERQASQPADELRVHHWRIVSRGQSSGVGRNASPLPCDVFIIGDRIRKGVGSSGPWSGVPAYGLVVEAMDWSHGTDNNATMLNVAPIILAPIPHRERGTHQRNVTM